MNYQQIFNWILLIYFYYYHFVQTMNNLRRQTLIALREKNSKSRTPSLNNSPSSMRSSEQPIIEECNSDEDIQDTIEPPTTAPSKTLLMIAKQDEKSSIIRRSVERLDNKVSNLHQDVATLSHEVRTAIQALQEMTYSTIQSQMVHHLPARSIPNLQIPNGCGNITSEYLIRSSSQPADIWHASEPRMMSTSDFLIR